MQTALAQSDHAGAQNAFFDAGNDKEDSVNLLYDGFVKEVLEMIWVRDGQETERLLCPDVFGWFLEKRAVYRRKGDIPSLKGDVVSALVRGRHLVCLVLSLRMLEGV
jgi:hypothetical protein